MNCVIVSSKYIDSISVLYLSYFICYKLLQLLKYAQIFSVYTKMRLFKSQKTKDDRAKTIYKFEFSTPKLTKDTYPHSCLRPKIYFCKPVLFIFNLILTYLWLNWTRGKSESIKYLIWGGIFVLKCFLPINDYKNYEQLTTYLAVRANQWEKQISWNEQQSEWTKSLRWNDFI